MYLAIFGLLFIILKCIIPTVTIDHNFVVSVSCVTNAIYGHVDSVTDELRRSLKLELCASQTNPIHHTYIV